MRCSSCLAVIAIVSPAGFGAEIADQFAQQEATGGYKEKPGSANSDKPLVTEIGIERTPCFGTCPIYTLVIKSDCTFRYHGKEFVDRKGDCTGTISREQFDRLAEMVVQSGFIKLHDKYSAPVTDCPTVFTMAVVDGNRKIVSDYASSGPPELLALDKAITDALGQSKWDEKK